MKSGECQHPVATACSLTQDLYERGRGLVLIAALVTGSYGILAGGAGSGTEPLTRTTRSAA